MIAFWKDVLEYSPTVLVRSQALFAVLYTLFAIVLLMTDEKTLVFPSLKKALFDSFTLSGTANTTLDPNCFFGSLQSMHFGSDVFSCELLLSARCSFIENGVLGTLFGFGLDRFNFSIPVRTRSSYLVS